MKANEEKARQLGMPFGTASHRLRKRLMFFLAEKCGKTICFRCGRPIESAEELSIDHKEDWLHSQNPEQLFFDLDNIAFSHRICNMKAGGKRKRIIRSKSGFRGVRHIWSSRGEGKWKAEMTEGNAARYIGMFDSAEGAALAYDKAVIEKFGDDAITNASLGALPTIRV